MGTFWINDLQDLSKLLSELNKRIDINPGEDYFTEESATIEIDAYRKDSESGVLVIAAEKSQNKDGSGWRQRVTLEWNLDYQTIDEVVYDLSTLLGVER